MAIYAFDFDGTLCEDKFPDIGPVREHAMEQAKAIKADGNILILWTCRCGERLQEAIDFCKSHGLEFDYVNENQCHLVKPVSTNFAAVPNFKNRYPYVTQNLKNITFPIIPDS